MNNQDQLTEKIKEIAQKRFPPEVVGNLDANYGNKVRFINDLTTALKDKSLLLMALKELEGEVETKIEKLSLSLSAATKLRKQNNIKITALEKENEELKAEIESLKNPTDKWYRDWKF